MLYHLLVAVLILECVPAALCQDSSDDDLPRPEFRYLTTKQVARLIFSKEQDTIKQLTSWHLVTETYVQSLGHAKNQDMDNALDEGSEGVIDDKYFLAEANLRHLDDGGAIEQLLVGRSSASQRIRTNTDGLEQLFPIGMLMMFFVDLNSFDADRYTLTYEGTEVLAKTECLLFAVEPSMRRDSGRFRGHIWIDSSSLHIARIKGVFAGPYKRWYARLKGPERYFHFDSWREDMGNGLWMPSFTYFEERRTFAADLNVEVHYRGYTLLWQQQEADGSVSAETPNPSGAISMATSITSSKNLISRLNNDGLLAGPGQVEQWLKGIIEKIAPTPALARRIDCRVLLTTPAEIFAVGDVIVVSRGFLNIVPDDSVLAVLLARQVAHIVLGQTNLALRPLVRSLFDERAKRDGTDLEIGWTRNQETAADEEALLLLKGSPYEDAIVNTRAFLLQLMAGSRRFPNLVEARFGASVVSAESFAASEGANTREPEFSVQLKNKYRVSWHREIVALEAHENIGNDLPAKGMAGQNAPGR
jgi:hypothetical protein